MHFDPERYCYTIVSSTFYGNWLPGDERGFVGYNHQQGNRVIHHQYDTPCDGGNDALRTYSKNQLKDSVVTLTFEQAELILTRWHETVREFSWSLFAAAIMPNHVHLVVAAPAETTKTVLLNAFKSYPSRVLNKTYGKRDWWTAGGSVRFCFDEETLLARINYVKNQANPLIIWINDKEPGVER